MCLSVSSSEQNCMLKDECSQPLWVSLCRTQLLLRDMGSLLLCIVVCRIKLHVKDVCSQPLRHRSLQNKVACQGIYAVSHFVSFSAGSADALRHMCSQPFSVVLCKTKLNVKGYVQSATLCHFSHMYLAHHELESESNIVLSLLLLLLLLL